MDRAEALRELGLPLDADDETIRRTFRRRIARAHPDVVGPQGTAATARLTAAWAVLQEPRAPEPEPPEPPAARPATPPLPHTDAEPGEQLLLLDAVGPDAFALLEEAAATVGYVSYIDRHLHLLEIVVRFEHGPSCSVVMSMQGRAAHTEVFVSMESLEAAPTPPMDPVIDALREALEALRGD